MRFSKQYLFWLAIVTLFVIVIIYDQSAVYFYIHRIFLVCALALIALCLRRLADANWKTYGAIALVIVSPYAVAPLPGTFLKNFFLNCGAIERGETKEEVAARMSRYATSLGVWGWQPTTIDEASPDSGRTPYIYIPSKAYDADFCMIYLRENKVDRVVISPD